MKTKTIKLYEFSELPEKAKEKALDKYRYINVGDGFWHDYDGKTGFSAKELKRMRVDVKDAPDELIHWKNMYFDLDYNYRYIQFTDADFTNDEVARKFLSVPKELWKKVYWSFVNKNYGGSSHGTTRLEYESQTGEDFTDKQREILDRAVERFSDKMEEVLKGLDSSYEYATSDEAIIETFEAEEYTFNIDGKIEN